MASTLANRTAASIRNVSLSRLSLNLFRTFTTSAPSSGQNPDSNNGLKKPKRRKKKNLFEVAQFLPNWGIGYQMAKSHWIGVSYQITKINLYKDGRHGKAWGIVHKEGLPAADAPKKISGVHKRCWKYIPNSTKLTETLPDMTKSPEKTAESGEFACEHLPEDLCSFAISSSGNRCLLEKDVSSDGNVKYQCKTSEVVVEGMMRETVATDDCVNACGLDRYTVGISSDSLFDHHFIAKICSPDCYQDCPNIVDLYSNLFLAEGGYLPLACEKHRANTHRFMIELGSSSVAAAPPQYAWTSLGPSSEPSYFDNIVPSAQ